MKNRGLIRNPEEVLLKLLNADEMNGGSFTIKSKRTGTEYTYRIQKSQWRDALYTRISIERRYGVWTRLGNYFRGHIWKDGKVETDGAKAIAWVLRQVEAGKPLSEVEVYHLGVCLRCARTLTTSESIMNGMGPTCARM